MEAERGFPRPKVQQPKRMARSLPGVRVPNLLILYDGWKAASKTPGRCWRNAKRIGQIKEEGRIVANDHSALASPAACLDGEITPGLGEPRRRIIDAGESAVPADPRHDCE